MIGMYIRAYVLCKISQLYHAQALLSIPSPIYNPDHIYHYLILVKFVLSTV